MFENIIENVLAVPPLIHCITNYVTVNDVANILLACGASPIMADDAEEVDEITSICGGLVINIGTLNSRTIESMLKAGRLSNALSHPVIFDPVGAGASSLRTITARRLLDTIRFSVIRANISEIKAAALGYGSTKGVDANLSDAITDDTLDGSISFLKSFSKKSGAVIAVTGAIDVVADSEKAYVIRNGHPMMSRVTGTGCMLTALTAAYCTANKRDLTRATAAAVCAMGFCGEIAFRESGATGTASLRSSIIDAMSRMDAKMLEEGAKVEIR